MEYGDDYGDKYSIQLLVEPKLEEAEQDFLEAANKSSVIKAIDHYEEGVRRARAFDAYTEDVYELIKDWIHEDEHEIEAVKTAVNSWLEEAKDDAITAKAIHWDDYSEGAQQGRADAIKALKKARYRLDELNSSS